MSQQQQQQPQQPQQRHSSAEGKDRTSTIAALVLVFDQEWWCANRESVTCGLVTLDIGALVLHQTRVRSSHLWLSPQIPLQSSSREAASTSGDSAPDPGDIFESPDMILEGNSNSDYLDEVVNITRGALKRRHCA